MKRMTTIELARLRRDELVAEAARARRVRVDRARTAPRAWGWRRGHLVPVPRPIERVDRAYGAGVDHTAPRPRRSNRNTARAGSPPDDPSGTAA